MKYAFSFLLITAAMVVTLFADNSNMPSATQRIANFISGGPGANLNQSMVAPRHDFTLPVMSPFNFTSTSSNGTGGNFDFSSFFSNLATTLNDHHFDPNAVNNLESFVNNLHLDPALLAKVQMFVQNLQNGNSQQGDSNSGSDENANNGNSGSDENADNENSGSDENANNQNNNEDENADVEDMDENQVQVPEPSTFVLMAAGAALLAATFVRRRAK